MTTDSAARTFVRSLHWRYALFAVCFLAFVAAMGAAEKMGLPRSWIGVSFMAVTIGTYAGIGFWCRTTDELEYYVAGRRVPAMYNGMATAADWMSAASFMGTAGVLYLQGRRGLIASGARPPSRIRAAQAKWTPWARSTRWPAPAIQEPPSPASLGAGSR